MAADGGDEADIEKQLRRFVEVFSVVEREAAEPVAPGVAFYSGAIPGMLKRLDPHSVFFDPMQFQQLQELEKSTRKGFGTVVSILPGRVIILQTMAGTPSARSGLGPGDQILAVNGIDLARLNIDQLVALLGQSRQREARLVVRKPGNARLMEFVMTPADVDAPSVDLAFFLEAAVAYIRVKSFEADTAGLLAETIEKHGGADLRALVLDLRGNPGGLMPAAIETAALFLPADTRLLTVRGRGELKEEIRAPEAKTSYEFPVAVLIDDRSASSSEIVAGALQDHGRATIVGSRSFGKGLVQSVYPLSENTGLALTTAFYFTPNGRNIQRPLRGVQLDSATRGSDRGGIVPDVTAYREAMSRLRIALQATGAFTTFATESLRTLGEVDEGFEVSSKLLDEFQAWLSARNIQPGISEWSADRVWIRSRLKQEIFNQSVGVSAGDQVEIRRDAQVIRAVEVLGLD
ncbi:MAG: S41 family peptidase [bacterium]|nr:S41 family peptidase [bacterium]